MMVKRCSVVLWITVQSIQLLFLSAIPTSFLRRDKQQSIYPLSSSSSRTNPNRHNQHHRSLEDVDGITACKNCKSSLGQKCVGRTIIDENCDSCSKGQTFWPCNLKKECWCWDTALPRDPGDDDDDGRACAGCGRGGDSEVCVSNQNSLVPVGDDECAKCMEGQSFWPCDDPDLCWCWDTTRPKKPPAPASGLYVASELDPNIASPCDILTREKFNLLAPNSTFPYTYEGLCEAIDDYNDFHTEKFAAMGTLHHITHELAAFLGNTAHESDDFEAGREYLACGDRKEVDGKVYCKPCNNDVYDWINNVCTASMVDQNAPYNSYCQPSFEPPEGCVCDTITQVEESGALAGYVEASKVFYGRGAIQLSWNYNYIRASYSLTGSAETFCNDPEQVATNPKYAWGSGIYFWMENQKEGTTCHKEALKGDFGGTLNNINGGLECPAYKGGWHADAIKMRLDRYCHAASELGLETLSSLDGCRGMMESYEECLLDGHCPYCAKHYAHVEPENFDNIKMPEPAKKPEETAPVSSPVVTPNVPRRTPRPTNPSPPTKAPAMPKVTVFPTIAYIPPTYNPATNAPTPYPSEGFKSSSPITSTPSPPPTLAPTTGRPSTSPINNPTQQPTSAEPSYAPTTPQPTMGPCDGDSCPSGLCRSAYGFCGAGDYYCNDNAIWSPECRENSDPPSPSPISNEPTESPIEQRTPILDGVFKITKSPEGSRGVGTGLVTRSPIDSSAGAGVITRSPIGSSAGAGVITRSPIGSSAGAGAITRSPVDSPGVMVVEEEGETMTGEPTKKPTAPSIGGGKFYKPTGGKKKPTGGGKPKPSFSGTNNSSSQTAAIALKEPSTISDSSTQTTDAAQIETATTPLPTPNPTPPPTREPITREPTTAPPTPKPTAIVFSLTDPEATYFCGSNWEEANIGCAVRCPSSKSEDCPRNQKCYAFTSCLDVGVPDNTDKPTDRPTNPPFTMAPVTPAPTSPAPTGGATQREGCSGTPCPFEGECRSQFGFCGISFIYCNAMSTWTLVDCGLVGPVVPGETMMVCDAETLQCPEGERVHRNPANDCEYFPCPVDEEEENAFTSAAFHVPAPTPRFPALPMPTLPTIDEPSPYLLPTIVKPSAGMIDLGKKSSGDGTLVVIGRAEGVGDDNEEELKDTENEDDAKDDLNENGFGTFSTRQWLDNNGSCKKSQVTYAFHTVAPLVLSFILAIIATL